MNAPAYLPAPTPAADAAVDLGVGLQKLAQHFIDDILAGRFVAARHTHKRIVEFTEQMKGAWLDAMEEQHGPAPRCKHCGMLEGFDCECPPFRDEDDARDVVF